MADHGASRRRGRTSGGLAVTLAIMVLSGLMATARPALALPGDLDPGFGTAGLALDGTPPGSYAAVTSQPDGRIVVAGTATVDGQADFRVVRYLSTGVLDLSFGVHGMAMSDFGWNEQATAMALQRDGKIVVSGTQIRYWAYHNEYQGVVARYNTDGTLDATFGTGGWVAVETEGPQYWIRSIVVQADGDLLLAGHSTNFQASGSLVRLHPDGSPDRSFSNRFPTYGAAVVYLPVPMDVAGADVLPDGRILVSGSTAYPDTSRDVVTLRLTPSGDPDPSFGDGGVARSRLGSGGSVNAMAVQPDGKVVLAGDSTPTMENRMFAVVRLTAAGHPDLTFGIGGQVLVPVSDAQNTWAAKVKVAADGSIFVAGWASAGRPEVQRLQPSRQFVAHFERTGVLDLRFGTGGVGTVVVGGEPQVQIQGLAVQADGAPVAVGFSMHPDTLLNRGFIFRLQAPRPGGPICGWGFNGWGQVGNLLGNVLQATVGVRARADVAAVSAGGYHSLSLDADGTVWGSGFNRFGQLGDGTTTDRSSPVQVVGLTGVITVSAGAYHSLAVKADGSVWAWGWNGFGQLGDGTTVQRTTPVRVADLGARLGVKVAAGAFHSLVLTIDGSVWAWGFNGFGQLGDGTTDDRHAPVFVAGLTGVASVSTGAYHSLALRPDGSLLSWGFNRFGQLGDGTTVDRRHPLAVVGVTGVVSVANGSWFHTLAVGVDGSAWAWGWNGYGQLGDGTTIERHAPVRVGVTVGVAALTGGGFHSVAVDVSGAVRAWGWNVFGQLGDGTLTDRHRPTRVPVACGLTSSVGAGAYHSIAG